MDVTNRTISSKSAETSNSATPDINSDDLVSMDSVRHESLPCEEIDVAECTTDAQCMEGETGLTIYVMSNLLN